MNVMNNQNEKGYVAPSRQTRFKVPTKYIPKLRSKLAEVLIITISGTLFSMSVWLTNSSYIGTILINLAFLPLFLAAVEVTQRIPFCIEEYFHISTRYDNSKKRFFKDMLSCPYSLTVAILLGIFFNVIIALTFENVPWVLWWQSGPSSVISSSLGILVLQRILKMNAGPLDDCLWIANSNGLDYGSGMAHSFFHGYLKLVLPKTGSEEKNLEELMKIYESTEQIKFAIYKLFILIPKSLHCPPTLMDVISPTISESKSLLEKKLTVAGVIARVYKNSVYKIKSQDGLIYVSAEYATPLKTFKDVVTHNGPHSNYYRKYQDEIVLQFYLTLQEILKEDPNCAPFCELIYYDDKNENGDYYDVGEILKARIQDIKRKNRANRQHQD